jgi:hypothetical protein
MRSYSALSEDNPMTSLVLNDETAKTTIGDVLASATDPVIDIKNESGELVARIVVNTEAQVSAPGALVEQAEAEVDELRRRRSADRSADVTTQQLLARAENQAKE